MDGMALQKLYDATPLQVLTSSEMRARIVRLKETTGMSQAAVIREILTVGVPMMEEMWGLGDGVE